MTSVYDIRTTKTASVPVSSYPSRTPDDYAANVAAKFGGQLPSLQELARLESKRMRERLGTNSGGMATHATYQIEGEQRYARAREASGKRLEEIHSRIFAVLTEGEATARDMARELDYHIDTARDYLKSMSRAGMIRAETVGQVRIYSLPRAEAAE